MQVSGQRYSQPLANGGRDDPPAVERTNTLSGRRGGSGTKTPGSRENGGEGGQRFEPPRGEGGGNRRRDGGGRAGEVGGGHTTTTTLRKSSRSTDRAQFNRVNSMIAHPTHQQQVEDDGPRFNRTLSMSAKTPKQGHPRAPPPPPEDDEEEEEGGQKFGRSMTLGSKPRFKSTTSAGAAQEERGGGGGGGVGPGALGRSMTLGQNERKGGGRQDMRRAISQDQQPRGVRTKSAQVGGGQMSMSGQEDQGGMQQQLKPALKKTGNAGGRTRNMRDDQNAGGQMGGRGGRGGGGGGDGGAYSPGGYNNQMNGDGMGGYSSNDMSYGDGYQNPRENSQDMRGQGRRREARGGRLGMEDGYYNASADNSEASDSNMSYGPSMRAGARVEQPKVERDGIVLPMLPPPGAPQVVQCQKCNQLLEVPTILPPAKKGVQKLRCGKCLRVSRFQVNPADPRSVQVFADSGHVERHAPPHGRRLSQSDMGEGGAGGGGGGGPMPTRHMRNRSRDSEDSQYLSEDPSVSEASTALAGGRRMIMHRQGSVDSADLSSSSGAVSPLDGSEIGGGAGDDKPTYSRRVVINGEPVRDDHVQIAEGRAGPIHPGNYWYDKVAGFWGEMGGPCLGIIPPGIEFGAPMPKNCAGGSTHVYVNGRELHKKDLERLIKRGLPPNPASYRIEITGNVYLSDSGEFILTLGKLAPSLETRKRGGGMKIPEY